uniref:Uncharacterized protein n=1 Tax=Romanomermis culicivorax TaxID=13658 RepID=A0A915J7F7_ROMCU
MCDVEESYFSMEEYLPRTSLLENAMLVSLWHCNIVHLLLMQSSSLFSTRKLDQLVGVYKHPQARLHLNVVDHSKAKADTSMTLPRSKTSSKIDKSD